MAPHNGLRIEQWTFLNSCAQLYAGLCSGAGAAVARHAAHNNNLCVAVAAVAVGCIGCDGCAVAVVAAVAITKKFIIHHSHWPVMDRVTAFGGVQSF